MKRLAIAVITATMLTGCGEEVVERAPDKVVAEEKPKEVNEVKPVKVEKTQAEIDYEAVTNYSLAGAPIMRRITENIDDLTEISNMSPEVVATDKYLETAILICDDLKRNVDEYQALDIGYNKRVEEIHKAFLLVMTELEFVANYYAYGIKIQDEDILEASDEAMENSRNYMVEATDMLLAEIGGS